MAYPWKDHAAMTAYNLACRELGAWSGDYPSMLDKRTDFLRKCREIAASHDREQFTTDDVKEALQLSQR